MKSSWRSHRRVVFHVVGKIIMVGAAAMGLLAAIAGKLDWFAAGVVVSALAAGGLLIIAGRVLRVLDL